MRTVKKKNYLNVTYSDKFIPLTSYPFQLVSFFKDKYFKKTGSILDVGCGRGDFLKAFNQAGLRASGLDISPHTTSLSKKYSVKKCDFERESFPIQNDSYDFVISKSVIEHLHDPYLLISECHRVLKKGGKGIFMCPSWIHTFKKSFYIDHTHVTPFTLYSLTQLLRMSDFKIIDKMYFTQLPAIWKYPILKLVSGFLCVLPLPYRPFDDINIWPEGLNKWIRFSKEKMLLVVVEK